MLGGADKAVFPLPHRPHGNPGLLRHFRLGQVGFNALQVELVTHGFDIDGKITLRPKRMPQTAGNFVMIFSPYRALRAGNIRFGLYQEIARQADNAFVRPTASGWRQFRSGCIRDVYADHGEVAVRELPNVRATMAGDSLRAVGVRVLADSAEKFDRRIHIGNDNRADVKKRQEQNTVHIR